jgi:hypothetical protein
MVSGIDLPYASDARARAPGIDPIPFPGLVLPSGPMMTRTTAGSAFPVCFALAALLAATPGAHEALAQEQTFHLTYPTQIGDLTFSEIRQATESDRATHLVYKAPGIALTIYIYGGGPDLPDGAESPGLNREFEQVKEAIHDPRAWKKAKDVREGQVDLGTAPHQLPAREAVFKVKSDAGKANSYLYLTALNHVFFKVRCTATGVKPDVEERNLAAIRVAVGDLIHKLFETPPDPSDAAPSTGSESRGTPV